MPALDPEQMGHDLHLTREGHGAGFWSRPNSDDPIMVKADEVAREMGEDYEMQAVLSDNFPQEAYAD